MNNERPDRRRVPWATLFIGFLLVVAAAHGFTVWLGVKEGGLVLVACWYYLAIPVFIPGFFVGAYILYAGVTQRVPYRALRVALGMAALAMPSYEWYLLGSLPSGWKGG